MQLSKILCSIVSLSLASKTIGAPFDKHQNLEVRDDEDPVVVHLTKTVHNIVTNTHVVKGEVSTLTNTVMNTDTTTTTRYTATVTSTVFGTPVTYTTVASTPISTENIKIPTETGTTTTTKSTSDPKPTSTSSTGTTKGSSTTPKPSPASKTPAKTKTAATTSQTTVTESASSNEGPSITDYANIPSSTGSWIIENVTTSNSDGVCDVDFDYYATGEPEETVTSTKTIYHTVTQS